jgi:hypothetical protein
MVIIAKRPRDLSLPDVAKGHKKEEPSKTFARGADMARLAVAPMIILGIEKTGILGKRALRYA